MLGQMFIPCHATQVTLLKLQTLDKLVLTYLDDTTKTFLASSSQHYKLFSLSKRDFIKQPLGYIAQAKMHIVTQKGYLWTKTKTLAWFQMFFPVAGFCNTSVDHLVFVQQNSRS